MILGIVVKEKYGVLGELINMNENNYNAYFLLSIIANLCQLADFQMNVSQLSNDDLMYELEKQDKVLDEQTNLYLKKIIEQNEEILKILKNIDKN